MVCRMLKMESSLMIDRSHGRMANPARVKPLVLVHVGPHISQPDSTTKGIVDIRKVRSGNVVYSDELMKQGL